MADRIVVGSFIRLTFRVKGGSVKYRARDTGQRVNINKSVANVIAGRMEQAALKQLEDRRRRDGGTGRLKRAISSEENVVIGPRSILMFPTQFLDREVPYWRAIDQGLDVGFVGRVLPGHFGRGGSGGDIAPAEKGGGRQSFTWWQDNMKGARAALRHAGLPGRPFIVVGKPIQAEGYVAAAVKAFQKADADLIARGLIDAFLERVPR